MTPIGRTAESEEDGLRPWVDALALATAPHGSTGPSHRGRGQRKAPLRRGEDRTDTHVSTAALALVISSVSLLLSLLLAAWDVVKYHRDGGRVRVTLEAGRLDSSALYRTSEPPPLTKQATSTMRFAVEVARITVENRGRTPVTVSDVVFDLGRTRRWSRRSRRTVGYNFLPFEDHSTLRKVRLEAYDAVSFLMDASHAIPVAMRSRTRPLRVRASVHVAGVGVTRSSRRRQWRLDPRKPARLWISGPFDLAQFMYQFVAWHFRSPEKDGASLVDMCLGQACMDIAREIEAGATLTTDDLETMLRAAFKDIAPERAPGSIMAAFALHDELENDELQLFSPHYYDESRPAGGGGSHPRDSDSL